jgi:hypothetical protein
MKKVFLLIATTLLISVSSNCQWYHRQYGVNDLNQLSQEQLNAALMKAKSRIRTGAILSTVSAIGIVGGIIIIAKTQQATGEGFLYGIYGLLLMEISIPIEIVGLVKLSKNSLRVKSIERVLNNAKISMGLVNFQRGNIYSSSQSYLLPCLSVTIRF